MSYKDTAQDPVIAIAIDASRTLKNLFKQKKIPFQINKSKILEITEKIETNLMQLRYSYVDHKTMLTLEPWKIIKYSISELLKEFPKDVFEKFTSKPAEQQARAELRYSLHYLSILEKKLISTSGDNPSDALDVRATRLLEVSKHPELNLLVTRVGFDEHVLTVVSNLLTLKKDDLMAVALLKPVKFGKIISEGMFSKLKIKNVNAGDVLSRDQFETGEYDGIVKEIIKNLH